MSEAAAAPRIDALLGRLDSWAEDGTLKALIFKVAVTVTGPLVIVAGVAMIVLPGPGLVVISAGLALLALEYPWARRTVVLMANKLSQAKQAALPKDGSPGRRALGVLLVVAVAVAGFVATTAITAFLGAHTVL